MNSQIILANMKLTKSEKRKMRMQIFATSSKMTACDT